MKQSLLMKIFFLCLTVFLLGNPSLHAQDLSQHRWDNRIILLLADSFENEFLEEQKKSLLQFQNELDERKLIIYEISPKYYRITTSSNQTQFGASTQYEKYNSNNAPFKFILIGLDGSVKLDEDAVVDPSVIFKHIDQMPMRMNELKNN